jgi:hypothetical protein
MGRTSQGRRPKHSPNRSVNIPPRCLAVASLKAPYNRLHCHQAIANRDWWTPCASCLMDSASPCTFAYHLLMPSCCCCVWWVQVAGEDKAPEALILKALRKER